MLYFIVGICTYCIISGYMMEVTEQQKLKYMKIVSLLLFYLKITTEAAYLKKVYIWSVSAVGQCHTFFSVIIRKSSLLISYGIRATPAGCHLRCCLVPPCSNAITGSNNTMSKNAKDNYKNNHFKTK